MESGYTTEEGLSYEDAEETIAEEERIGLAVIEEEDGLVSSSDSESPSTVFACAIPAPNAVWRLTHRSRAR